MLITLCSIVPNFNIAASNGKKERVAITFTVRKDTGLVNFSEISSIDDCDNSWPAVLVPVASTKLLAGVTLAVEAKADEWRNLELISPQTETVLTYLPKTNCYHVAAAIAAIEEDFWMIDLFGPVYVDRTTKISPQVGDWMECDLHGLILYDMNP